MKHAHQTRIRDLIDRLARISAAEDWEDSLNPAQRGALAYLAQANRFSRAPSHVADYLGTTRGTASQTLKALERKGFIMRVPSMTDRRSLSYELTAKGIDALNTPSDLDAVLHSLDPPEAEALKIRLEQTLGDLLAKRGQRSFGICSSCKFHEDTTHGARCMLLGVELDDHDAGSICHEHTDRSSDHAMSARAV